MLRALKEQHHITYMALCPAAADQQVRSAAQEYSDAQTWIPWEETPKRSFPFFLDLAGNLFSPLPYAIAKYESAGMAEKIREADASGKFDVIVCDFLFPAINVLKAGKLQTPTLLFQHNVEALIWKRLFDKAAGVKKHYFRSQWNRMVRFERETSTYFDGVVGVSEEDCEIMRKEYGLGNVLGAVPTGVDVAYFEQVARDPKPNHIAFLGSMDWMPNIDAIRYFTEEIWPLLKAKNPSVRFTIIGRNPPGWIAELPSRDSAITVTGTVPDVRPYLAEAAALVVPLRVGGGTRIKIFEAVAAGVPVVSTSIGMEGLPLTHRETILVADSSREFADATLELLSDAALAATISTRARDFVREKYSWAGVTEIFSGYCRAVVRK